MLILGRCIQQRIFVGEKITVTMDRVDRLFVDVIVDIEEEDAERLEWRLFLGKTLAITENITVTLLRTQGQQAWLGFDAPTDVGILREELSQEQYIQTAHDKVCQCKERLCNTRLDIHEAMGY